LIDIPFRSSGGVAGGSAGLVVVVFFSACAATAVARVDPFEVAQEARRAESRPAVSSPDKAATTLLFFIEELYRRPQPVHKATLIGACIWPI
jgi:hypothetical protein